MDLIIRAMDSNDLGWVLALYQANARDALTPRQRARQGFVQGRMSRESLSDMLEGPGAYVAVLDGKGVAALFTHEITTVGDGPGAHAGRLAIEEGLPRPFLYGPVVVAEQARGQGVMRKLSEHALRQAAARFETAVAFTDAENPASAAAHRRLGWQPIGTFDLGERSFEVITHDVIAPDSSA